MHPYVHPGYMHYCTPLGTPLSLSGCTCRTAARYGRRELAALERTVTELTVAVGRVTVRSPVSLLDTVERGGHPDAQSPLILPKVDECAIQSFSEGWHPLCASFPFHCWSVTVRPVRNVPFHGAIPGVLGGWDIPGFGVIFLVSGDIPSSGHSPLPPGL